MKKLLCLSILSIISLLTLSQPQWVAFTDPVPSAPIVTLQSSSNQQVIYSIQLPGMFQESITVDTVTFQRISIPRSGSWGYPGYPELPAIPELIAIPECDSVSISCLVTDSVILNNYNVYPAPEIVFDSLTGKMIEQFTWNDSVYQLNLLMPEKQYDESAGSLRNQRTTRLAFYPLRYSPAAQQLKAYTQIEITLSFPNSTGTINVENGLFNKLCNSSFLNFNMEDRSLPPYPVPSPGEVEWLEIEDTAQACQIDADYLIITDDQFFDPHSAALQMFANHRISFNGFKITIVNVQDILSDLNPFYYDPSKPYKNEQKIRSFIKRVYEGAQALHTYDGRVAFVLLVGDAQRNSGSSGVPASTDPNPTGDGNNWYCDNDYYYSCVTKNPFTGKFDLDGDLFIGRFCADYEAELYNIAYKTKKYETEIWSGASNGEWRKRNLLAYGWGTNDIYRIYFCDSLKNWLEDLYSPEYTTSIVDGTENANTWNSRYVDSLRIRGYNLVIDYGHGQDTIWCGGSGCYAYHGALTLRYKKDNLQNSGQWPFAIANACETGRYSQEEPDCIGEETTVYSSENGYVASLYISPGSWNILLYK